ncbi:MAG: S41 family peptidase [Armatimonadetes bacterium]|nr:S41 family peptidase [Armatimonadota bacterium]
MSQSGRKTALLWVVPVFLIGLFFWGRSIKAQRSHDKSSLHNRLENLLRGSQSASLVGFGGGEGQGTVSPELMYEEILEAVKAKFVDETFSDARVSNGSLNRMFASLNDPRSNYLDVKMRQTRTNALQGNFEGVGAVIQYTRLKKETVDYQNLTVVSVMPGSPAEKAGLKSGDNVMDINGHGVITYGINVDIDKIIRKTNNTDAQKREELKILVEKYRLAYTLPKALLQLTTGVGATLNLKVDREGKQVPITITTAKTVVDPVQSKMIGKVGYLRVVQFNGKATTAFEQALKTLQAQATKGIVIDLRQNPGGVTSDNGDVNSFQSAKTLLADLLGTATAQLERKPNVREPLKIGGNGSGIKAPYIVLVDKGTSNIAEFVASTLHDTRKIKIIGGRTFGDPVLQLLTFFKNGTGAELTTAHFLTTAGTQWTNGIQPDVSAGDNALDQAVSALGG